MDGIGVATGLGALSDLIVALAAGSGAIVAMIGLNTWKKQNYWSIDHDLAKRLLLATYKYRDSLYSVRHPAMSETEMTSEEAEIEGISARDRRAAGIIGAYAKRWEKHLPFRAALDAMLLETDAVWGKELRSDFSRIFELERELLAYINLHLRAWMQGETELAAEYQRILKKKRDILYDSLEDDKDEFRKDFVAALERIEASLRPKLGRAL